MIIEIAYILIPFLGLAMSSLLQVLIYRYLKADLLKSTYLGFLIGFCGVFFSDFFIYLSSNAPSPFVHNFPYILMVNILSFAALCSCYFNFICLGETSRRVRILRELYDSKGGLTIEELLGRYNAKEIVEKRIARLINTGQIIERNDKYYIYSPIVLSIARIITVLRLILLGKRSDFD